jgi:hypothetical protein
MEQKQAYFLEEKRVNSDFFVEFIRFFLLVL